MLIGIFRRMAVIVLHIRRIGYRLVRILGIVDIRHAVVASAHMQTGTVVYIG